MSGYFINAEEWVDSEQVLNDPGTTTATTDVYFWNLNDESADNIGTSPSYTQNLTPVHNLTVDGLESVVNSIDGRTLVDLKDYQDKDSKYRAIVKLFLFYDNQAKNGVTPDEAPGSWLPVGFLRDRRLSQLDTVHSVGNRA